MTRIRTGALACAVRSANDLILFFLFLHIYINRYPHILVRVAVMRLEGLETTYEMERCGQSYIKGPGDVHDYEGGDNVMNI